MSTLNATDLFAVRRGSQTYKVSYQDVLAGVVLPSVLTYMGATNPAAAAPAPAGGLKAGMTYVLTPAGTLSAGWTGIAGINATDGQLAIWEGAKWELIGNTGAIPQATETVSGIVELATAAETTTGTDATRAVHPAGLKVELDKKATKTITSNTAPTNPADGDLWYDSVGGELYVWYDSDDAGAVAGTWVQANPQPTPKQATASVAGVDVKLWKKTGTLLEPETAGDKYLTLTAATAVTTPAASVDFTSIPSWVKRITVCLDGLKATGQVLIQMGTASGVSTGNYASLTTVTAAGIAGIESGSGFSVGVGVAPAHNRYGQLVITNSSPSRWVASGTFGIWDGTTAYTTTTGGAGQLTGTLDRIRVTGGITAGSINIMYEG